MIALDTVLEAAKREWTTIIFSLLFLAAWVLNALKMASFDLGSLTLFYTTVRGAFLLSYTVDSTANSPKGEHPYVKPSRIPDPNEKDGC